MAIELVYKDGVVYMPGLNLNGADLSGRRLNGANFKGSSLIGAEFCCSSLIGADFQDADLQDVTFLDADLQGANFRNAVLQGVDLRCADLRGADLRGAILRYTHLRGADLRGADLREVDLDFSSGIPFHCGGTQAKIDDRIVAQMLYLLTRQDTRWCSGGVQEAMNHIRSLAISDLFCEFRDDVLTIYNNNQSMK